MGDPRELLAAYDAQLRTASEMLGAEEVRRLGPLGLGVFPGGSGFVSYRDLGDVQEDGVLVEVFGDKDRHPTPIGLMSALFWGRRPLPFHLGGPVRDREEGCGRPASATPGQR